jgi:hypothetical protein
MREIPVALFLISLYSIEDETDLEATAVLLVVAVIVPVAGIAVESDSESALGGFESPEQLEPRIVPTSRKIMQYTLMFIITPLEFSVGSEPG